ncbi:MAG: hypothetical protein A2Y07_07615 [Planctomycetes bacterium GWF2_50_10]|nr:MAG: hypothetical protein A2Y07_07615 [Planctomycetes bacterium GWF2_50_10]
MSSKNSNIFDQHLDKIVFGVAGVVALYILYAFVISSPTRIEYDGEKFGPGSLDTAIRDKAQTIERKIKASPEPPVQYASWLDKFVSSINVPFKGIDMNLCFVTPGENKRGPDFRYNLPVVMDVCDVKVKALATVAYIPTETVDTSNPYGQANVEAGDLDLVTVEGKIDAAALSKLCNDTFNDPTIAAEFRRPLWAKPIFAAVELQRRQMLEDGSWGEWVVVKRTQAETLREAFNLPAQAKDLKTGLDVLMRVYDRLEVKAELLQPSTYDLAYPAQEWLPPSLEEKRASQPKPRRTDVATATPRPTRNVTPRTNTRAAGGAAAGGMPGMPGMGGGGMPGMGGGMPGMGAAGGARTTRQPVTRPNPRTTAAEAAPRVRPTENTDFAGQLAKMRISDKIDYTKLKEPVTFWAHDDSTEPGNTYQYRIRIGIFNPTAGTGWVTKEFEKYKDDVILWSNYSRETAPVSISQRWYFFPLDYRDADKAVTVKVARCHLAKWYLKDFRVRPGETIGKVVENIKEEDASVDEPNFIDYTNSMVVVDVLGPTQSEKDYAQVLYSADSKQIRRLGVKPNWPAELKSKFGEIDLAANDPREDLLPRGSDRRGYTPSNQGTDGMPGMGMPGMGMPGMGMPGMGMPPMQ